MARLRGQTAALVVALLACLAPQPLLARPRLAASANGSFSPATWMGDLAPVLANQTLLDMALPGTHDSMTFDLSLTVSDGANDINPKLAWILHTFSALEPGPFIRNQSRTQGLSMASQLAAGVRFIDFRIMWSAPPDSQKHYDWYSLHFLESKNTARTYLSSARAFLDAHPGEILVLWLSRHGSECATGNDQFPNITPAEKAVLWQAVLEVFDGMLFDTSTSAINTTTYAEMIARNQRVVIFASDYKLLTNSSQYALDGCRIDNQLMSDVTNITKHVASYESTFQAGAGHRSADKAAGRFWLLSMAGEPPDAQVEDAALVHFDPISRDKHRQECAALFHNPNMTDWCPMSLIEVAQLVNFYSQIAIDKVNTDPAFHLPHAIYIGAVDSNGLIRTGTQPIPPQPVGPGVSRRSAPAAPAPTLTPAQQAAADASLRADELYYLSDDAHGQTGYAYTATVALYNLRLACTASSAPAATCSELRAPITAAIAANPLTRWDDPAHGRHSVWPE